MPLNINVDIKGMDRIQEDIKRFGQPAKDRYRKAALDSAKLLATAVRNSQRTPVDTGFMLNKTGYQQFGEGAMMYVAAKYAVIVHQGIPSDIKLAKGRNIFIPGVGWRRITVIKARAARPFVDWALQDGAQERIDAIWGKAASDIIGA